MGLRRRVLACKKTPVDVPLMLCVAYACLQNKRIGNDELLDLQRWPARGRPKLCNRFAAYAAA